MVRRPNDPPVWDSLWTEDGKIFLTQSLSQSFLDTLATSYFGYLHTVPRLITNAASWFPIEDMPLVMSLLTCLVVALLSVYVFEASGAWIASPVIRVLLALAVAFAPVTARELSGTVSNVHWYLIYASFWAVICPWRTRGWLAASTAVVVASVLSDPLTAVLLPLGVVAALAARDRRAWILPAAIVGGLVVQLGLRDEGTTFFGGREWQLLPRIFAERVTSSVLAGDRYLEDLFGGRVGSPFAWASLAVVTLVLAAGLWRLRGRRRWLVAIAAVLSVAFFLIPAFSRGTIHFFPTRPWLLASTRYIYLPVLFLLTALALAADRATRGPTRPRLPEIAFALLLVGTMATSYAAPHRTEGTPSWRATVKAGRIACRQNHENPLAELYYNRGLIAVLPIAPTPGSWRAVISCARLTQG
ncbi:MAG TPA: hypothetical protein VJT75_08090 [Thermoleophilaceae bacterium]|nr:hypothetical protein [Thermoleophilaceae bacterium]